MPELYDVANVQKVVKDGYYWQIVRTVQSLSGKVHFTALFHDDETGDRIEGMPVVSAPTLEILMGQLEDK